MTSKATSVWLPRVLFESLLIVASILLALALDEWREDRENAENVQKALSNFLSEIEQNKAAIDDAAPFNRGLQHVLTKRQEVREIETVGHFVDLIESYSPVVLRSTAWETALATGSFSKMDYSLVSALSLTYGLQNRYLDLNRRGMFELTSPQNLKVEGLNIAVFNAIRYLEEVTRMEAELGIVYSEAIAVIEAEIANSDGVIAGSAATRQ